MKQADPAGLLSDMLEALLAIESYTSTVTFEQFAAEPMRQDAVIRQLQLTGEAARKLPGLFRNRYPAVPWLELVGMRHRLVHDYAAVDLSIIWDTVLLELPHIRQQIVDILSEAGKA